MPSDDSVRLTRRETEKHAGILGADLDGMADYLRQHLARGPKGEARREKEAIDMLRQASAGTETPPGAETIGTPALAGTIKGIREDSIFPPNETEGRPH